MAKESGFLVCWECWEYLAVGNHGMCKACYVRAMEEAHLLAYGPVEDSRPWNPA